jgi:integrase/recombinase XerD
MALFLWTLKCKTMIEIETYSKNFNTYLFRLGYAESTIKHNSNDIKLFLSHLQLLGITELKQVQPKHIIAYNEHLHTLKSKHTKAGLCGKTIGQKINVVKLFSQFLEATERIKIFTTEVDIVKSIKQHKEILSQEQIKELYNQTDDSVKGMRDRVILGLYYGCGLRYKEGLRVEMNHIDYKKELLFITPSKNYHSRYVPINNQVLKDFKDYEMYARSPLNPPKGDFFLAGSTSNGTLNKLLQNLCEKAKINTCGELGRTKQICLHSLRHSIATHLLQQEMPLEQIAKFLGHRTIRATQIYTHIVENLKQEQ